MKQQITVHWFRQDLRLLDNPAFYNACQNGVVLPIYILDDVHCSKDERMGEASQWWLHHSLQKLNGQLNGFLQFFKGDPFEIFESLIEKYSIKSIHWNRCYEPWQIKRDQELKLFLKKKNISVYSENASLLWEPWQNLKDDKQPYKVFTPFFNKGCLGADKPRKPLPLPKIIDVFQEFEQKTKIDDLHLLPHIKWYEKFDQYWNIGEEAALNKLYIFLQDKINSYKKGRDFPEENSVSKLSPHLHFGEISPHQIWYATKNLPDDHNTDHFCRELGWREFSYSQLYHFEELPKKNLQSKFDSFPWEYCDDYLTAWKKGQTGIPMVDAGMRELWETGYMHNRVRMIVGSFLVKNLLIDWRLGAQWFWDTLVDADLANNSASWQWIAGCGADAAPYFRIFNPITQGEKFDPNGEYIRRFIPELNALPLKYLYAPWDAPADVLKKAGIILGVDYPHPIVDLSMSRQKALSAFETLKTS